MVSMELGLNWPSDKLHFSRFRVAATLPVTGRQYKRGRRWLGADWNDDGINDSCVAGIQQLAFKMLNAGDSELKAATL